MLVSMQAFCSFVFGLDLRADINIFWSDIQLLPLIYFILKNLLSTHQRLLHTIALAVVLLLELTVDTALQVFACTYLNLLSTQNCWYLHIPDTVSIDTQLFGTLAVALIWYLSCICIIYLQQKKYLEYPEHHNGHQEGAYGHHPISSHLH